MGAVCVAAALAVAACSSDDRGSGTTSASTTGAASSTSAGTASPSTSGGGSSSPSNPSSSAASAATEGGTLRVRVAANPSSLDPQAGPSGGDHQMLYPLYDTLITFDPATLQPEPNLAKSWKFTDPTTLELTLQSGVTFQDGSAMDAAAVKASLDRYKTQTNKADLANVTSIDAPTADTVVLHLGTPDSSMVLVLADRAGMIVGPTATTDSAGFADHPVGAGPYKFASFAPGNKLVLERYDGYWNKRALHLDGIEFVVISDPKAAANALQSGQVDFSDSLDTADLDALRGNSKLHTQADIGEWFNMIYFNLAQKPLDDPKVRTAINMAIDRDALIAGVADGEGEPAWLPVPKAHWSYDPTSIDAWPHDLDAAKQLLADAGYPDGTKFTMVTTPDAPSTREADIIKDQLSKIGIDVEVTTMDSNQAISQYFEAQAFNSSLLAWSGRPDPGQTYQRLFAKDTYQNPGKVAIPGLDDAMAKAVTTDDIDERKADYAEVNKILDAAAPYAPLFYRPDVTAFSTKVQGYQASLLGKPKVQYLWLSD
ncbi:MAG: ABC transporter substrate-binding protein [Ilumatobacteraceae bacterium]